MMVACFLLVVFSAPLACFQAQWTTATLSQGRFYLAATSVKDVALFGGGFSYPCASATVDIYNTTSGKWTTATLSQARVYLATSLWDLAFFAGGQNNASKGNGT